MSKERTLQNSSEHLHVDRSCLVEGLENFIAAARHLVALRKERR